MDRFKKKSEEMILQAQREIIIQEEIVKLCKLKIKIEQEKIKR